MQFHHVGIPTTQKREKEIYLEPVKLFVTDANADPYHVEWLRFEEGSPMPEVMKHNPHVAYFVDNLAAAMEGHEVLVPPFVPLPGLEVAFIVHDGALIELMERKP